MTMKQDPRFAGIEPFTSKIWLASPTMHGDEQKWVDEAIRTNWVSTVGENIDEVERQIAAYIGCNCVVGLSCGTAALHLAIRLAGEKLYGIPKVSHGSLEGHRVFASDMTFDATVNPITYEGGEPVFIDTETDTWNMDPKALEKAFEIYPDVKLIVVAHLYGTPGKIDEIRAIADKHGALIVEDAAESLGAAYKGKQTGTFGDYSVISFNGNKDVPTHIVIVLWITLFNREAGESRATLTPFWEYAHVFNNCQRKYYTEQIIENILLFIPLGIMFPFLPKFQWAKYYKVLIFGLLFSAFIELLQYFSGRGLMEFDDVFNNTIGTMLGYGIYKLIK